MFMAYLLGFGSNLYKLLFISFKTVLFFYMLFKILSPLRTGNESLLFQFFASDA